MPAFRVVNPGANIQGPALDWFLRNDNPTGLNNAGTPPPEAIAQLQQLIAQGVVAPEDNTGQSIMAQYGIYGAPNYSGAADLGGLTSRVFSQVPGLAPGERPTVQLQQLLESSLNADRNAQLARDTFNEAVRSGDRAAALAAKTEADQYAIQSRNLDQQASQFAQTFGLQKEEAEARIGLAQRAQYLSEAQYGTQLAAHPENLIESALWQGSRRQIPVPQQSALGTPLDRSLQGAAAGQQPVSIAGLPLGGQPGDQAAAVGGQPGALPLDQIIAAQQAQTVPVPAIVNALNARQYVPATGVANASGSLISLGQLQNDPAYRVNAAGLDLASLSHLNTVDQGNLISVLGAQGQSADAFNQSVKNARAGQRSASLVRAY